MQGTKQRFKAQNKDTRHKTKVQGTKQGARHKTKGARHKTKGARHKAQGKKLKPQGKKLKLQGTRHNKNGMLIALL